MSQETAEAGAVGVANAVLVVVAAAEAVASGSCKEVGKKPNTPAS
jgi:hypothetical protein